MKLFGFEISRSKNVSRNDTRAQIGICNAAQGPLSPYFQDYYFRKVSGSFYEALREGIPVIDAAIRRLISLNGTIRVIGDNPVLVKELEDFCLNVPVNDKQVGIQAFLENAGNETFEQGFALGEFVVSADMKDIAGLRVADSKDIVFRRNAKGGLDTWYRNAGRPGDTLAVASPGSLVERILTAEFNQQVLIGGVWEEKLHPGNKMYFSINNENTNPYGVSLMRSMEFCAKLLATMQNSLGNVWERFGDPSYHVSYGLTKRSLAGETLEERRKKIADDFAAAVRAKRNGKSADFVSALNADDTMEIKVIGADNQVLDLEVPARHVLEQIVSKTGLPSWMLGIYWSTTERMATLEVETILQDAKVRQLAMLPEFIRLFSTYLKLRGHSWSSVTTSMEKPGDWGMVFETPNLRDMVAQAQARFLNAQADMMGAEQETEDPGESGKAAPGKKSFGADGGCGCGQHRAKEIHRTDDWPELDQLEDDYEQRLKDDWQELHERVKGILGLGVPAADKGVTRDSFTFSVEERAAVLAALKQWLGRYRPENENSPLTWYYGQAYSLGLVQAAHLVGKDRPILDLIKNREIYETLRQDGFDLVKNNATRRLKEKILAEMEAHAIAGSNPVQVAARLEKLFGAGNSDWKRLARSEMSLAAERAKLQEWQAWDVAMVEFTPAPDACPLCMSLRGDYPIEKAPVPVADTHPRCRCANRPAASEVDSPKMEMPPPRYYPAATLLAKGKDAAFYLSAFMARFGAEAGDTVKFVDVTGTELEISDKLFRDRNGKLKLFKRGREVYVVALAETIKNPDEIRLVPAPEEGLNDRRRYISRQLIEGHDRPGLVVFEETDDGWEGVTAFPPDASEYERIREGELIWKRE